MLPYQMYVLSCRFHKITKKHMAYFFEKLLIPTRYWQKEIIWKKMFIFYRYNIFKQNMCYVLCGEKASSDKVGWSRG